MARQPGRSKSLKRPDIYDALRRKGMSKRKAARISNAVANKTVRHRGGNKGRKHKRGRGKRRA
ncbi:hypothetical protein PBI_PIPEFISH_80 [Mycobacterium phage Pipefish]|uniref:Uncharacterized protein n=2 Tax=Pipefishvirus TaxID=1982899 RepID=Q19YS5_9CAUD|nr:gp80 [Mycobacterium phage Pipefish]ABD58577.1 hypothetical protein PBI_PIPEFISH_80 [Mycobacterium phage Pipefish]AVJ49082.1 hypothetical protein PBI_BALOO_77 [Mycobacterium phage Baloo]